MRIGSHSGRRASPAKVARDFSGDQSDLFGALETPTLQAARTVDLDIHYELLGAVNKAIRHARAELEMSREDIVETMNRLLPELDKPITLRQLNSWTAASKVEQHPFPLRFISAFCKATDCVEPLRIVVSVIGFALVDARDLEAKQLGEELIQVARLKRTIRQRQTRLGG